MARALVFLALATLIAVPVQGWSFELQLEGGQCRLGVVRGDTFQNTDMHTDNYLRPACGTLALASHWGSSERWGWRVGFKYIGEIQARDNYAVNDSQAHHHTAPCNPPTQRLGCPLRFNGVGRTFGITTGLTGDIPLTSRFKVGGEAGLFFFQHHFKADAKFDYCTDCPQRQIAYNETSKIWSDPAPFLGLTLRWRDVYFAARHYWPTGHRPLSLWDTGKMNELVVGAAITFR